MPNIPTIRQPFGESADNQLPLTSYGVGTAATGVTAVEYGDGVHHKTVLTVSSTLPAIAGGAALAVGKLLYTLPAGAHAVKVSYMSMALTAADGNIDADTPDVGVGTVIGSGAVAVLGGTATFENLIRPLLSMPVTINPTSSIWASTNTRRSDLPIPFFSAIRFPMASTRQSSISSRSRVATPRYTPSPPPRWFPEPTRMEMVFPMYARMSVWAR